jgi:hypothetical protein
MPRYVDRSTGRRHLLSCFRICYLIIIFLYIDCAVQTNIANEYPRRTIDRRVSCDDASARRARRRPTSASRIAARRSGAHRSLYDAFDAIFDRDCFVLFCFVFFELCWHYDSPNRLYCVVRRNMKFSKRKFIFVKQIRATSPASGGAVPLTMLSAAMLERSLPQSTLSLTVRSCSCCVCVVLAIATK